MRRDRGPPLGGVRMAMHRMAMWAGGKVRLLQAVHSGRLHLVELVVAADGFRVIGGDTRETDQLPADQVLVATVSRIGEEAVHRVREEPSEKRCAWDFLEVEIVGDAL